MIETVVGVKGSGKSSIFVDEIIDAANEKDNNIVAIESGKRFHQQIPYQVRLIDISEYPVESYRELLTFIAGVCAQDHDITHFYIDSLYKVAKNDDLAELETFIEDLEKLTANIPAKFAITISDEPEKMPENVKKYMR